MSQEPPAVSQEPPAVSQAPPAVSLHPRARWRAVSQAVCCPPCRAPYRRVGRHVARPLRRIVALPTPYRGASPSRVTPISRYNPAAKPRTCHDTPIRIATQSPSSQALARAPLALRASRPYRGLSRLYRGRVPGRIVALATCPCAPCVTIQCTVS